MKTIGDEVMFVGVPHDVANDRIGPLDRVVADAKRFPVSVVRVSRTVGAGA